MALHRSLSCNIDGSGSLLSTVISAQELLKESDLVERSGFLLVKVNRFSWKQRFVILTKDRLLVYKTPTSLSPQENIRLSGYQGLKRYTAKFKDAIWAFELFQIHKPSLKSHPAHKFSCCSDNERFAWMAAVKNSLYSANSIHLSDYPFTTETVLNEEEAEIMYKHLEALVFTYGAQRTHMGPTEERRPFRWRSVVSMFEEDSSSFYDENYEIDDKKNRCNDPSPSNSICRGSSQAVDELRKNRRVTGAALMSSGPFRDSGLWEETSSQEEDPYELLDAPFQEDELERTDNLLQDYQNRACTPQVESRDHNDVSQIHTNDSQPPGVAVGSSRWFQDSDLGEETFFEEENPYELLEAPFQEDQLERTNTIFQDDHNSACTSQVQSRDHNDASIETNAQENTAFRVQKQIPPNSPHCSLQNCDKKAARGSFLQKINKRLGSVFLTGKQKNISRSQPQGAAMVSSSLQQFQDSALWEENSSQEEHLYDLLDAPFQEDQLEGTDTLIQNNQNRACTSEVQSRYQHGVSPIQTNVQDNAALPVQNKIPKDNPHCSLQNSDTNNTHGSPIHKGTQKEDLDSLFLASKQKDVSNTQPLGAITMSPRLLEDSGLWEQYYFLDGLPYEFPYAPFQEDQLKHTDTLFQDDKNNACRLQAQSSVQDDTFSLPAQNKTPQNSPRCSLKNSDKNHARGSQLEKGIQNPDLDSLFRTSEQNDISTSQPQGCARIETSDDQFITSALANETTSVIGCNDTNEDISFLYNSSLENMCSTVDGCLSDEELLSLLQTKAKGAYLIRKSRAHDRKILSVYCGVGEIANFNIYFFDENRQLTIDLIYSFDSINDMLKAYTEQIPLPNHKDLKLWKGIHYLEMGLFNEEVKKVRKDHDKTVKKEEDLFHGNFLENMCSTVDSCLPDVLLLSLLKTKAKGTYLIAKSNGKEHKVLWVHCGDEEIANFPIYVDNDSNKVSLDIEICFDSINELLKAYTDNMSLPNREGLMLGNGIYYTAMLLCDEEKKEEDSDDYDKTGKEEEDLLYSNSYENMSSAVDSCLPDELLLSVLKSKAKGTYLLRNSNEHDQKILSVHCGGGEIANFLIFVENESNSVSLNRVNCFDSINDLLKAYTEQLPLPNLKDLNLGKGIYCTQLRLQEEKEKGDRKGHNKTVKKEEVRLHTYENMCPTVDSCIPDEKLLSLLKTKTKGTYLIRTSEEHDQEMLLVHCGGGEIANFPIYVENESNKVSLDTDISFDSIKDLLKAYTEQIALPTHKDLKLKKWPNYTEIHSSDDEEGYEREDNEKTIEENEDVLKFSRPGIMCIVTGDEELLLRLKTKTKGTYLIRTMQDQKMLVVNCGGGEIANFPIYVENESKKVTLDTEICFDSINDLLEAYTEQLSLPNSNNLRLSEGFHYSEIVV